jgi:MFS family permease
LAHAQQITIPTLIPYFHLTTGQQAWVSAAQGIPAGSFLLLFGRLADIFGRKRVLLVSLMSHATGGVVCGLSKHM